MPKRKVTMRDLGRALNLLRQSRNLMQFVFENSFTIERVHDYEEDGVMTTVARLLKCTHCGGQISIGSMPAASLVSNLKHSTACPVPRHFALDQLVAPFLLHFEEAKLDGDFAYIEDPAAPEPGNLFDIELEAADDGEA